VHRNSRRDEIGIARCDLFEVRNSATPFHGFLSRREDRDPLAASFTLHGTSARDLLS